MQSWGAPLAAVTFWAGLLVWDGRPTAVASWAWWVWVLLGGVALAAAWAAAPGRRRTDALHVAGLTSNDHPSVAAVAAAATDRRRGPAGALVLLIVGVLLCGIGWAGLSAPATNA